MVTYSDEELLEHLRKCYQKHGKVTQQILNQDDEFASGVLIGKRFGGLNNARDKAGLPRRNKGQNYTNEELKEKLKECQEKHGHVSIKVLDEDSELPASATVIERFDSLDNVRNELGLDKPEWGMTKEEVIERLKEVYNKHGRVTTTELREEGYSRYPISRHFDSMSDARQAVGIPEPERKHYSKDELIDFMKMCESEYGYCSGELMDRLSGYPSITTLENYFGSVSNALEEANVETYDPSDDTLYSDEELLSALRECASKHGRVNWELINTDDDFPNGATIHNRFESFKKACEKAGVSEHYMDGRVYTKEDVDKILKECEEKHGHLSQSLLLNDDSLCSPNLVIDIYGSLREAADELNLQYGTNECPVCNNYHCGSLGHHWKVSDCSPNITKEQKDIFRGMALGDGSISEDLHLHTRMTNYKFLSWLDDKLAYLSTGVRHSKTPKESAESMVKSGLRDTADYRNYRHLYSLSTRYIEWLSELRDWYEPGQIQFPEHLELSPMILKIWYVSDGHVRWTKDDRVNALMITSRNEEDNLHRIAGWFSNTPLSPNVNGCRLSFIGDDVEQMLSYMGDAPPGFEYKWKIDDRKVYEKLHEKAYSEEHYTKNF